MNVSAERRLSFVTYVVSEWRGCSPLGRKALQKLIHISTDALGYNTGYEFSFYTYGAFCRELVEDVELLHSRKALDIRYKQLERSYQIEVGGHARTFIESFDKEFDDKSKLDKMLVSYCPLSARDLEAISTFVYVGKNEGTSDRDGLIKRLIQLKPKYTISEAKKSYRRFEEIESFN